MLRYSYDEEKNMAAKSNQNRAALGSRGKSLENVEESRAEIQKELRAVEARFQAELQSARIELIEPDFTFPNKENLSKKQRTSWNRIRNRYLNSKKNNELGPKFGRSQLIINELISLTESFPNSVQIWYNLAIVAQKAEKEDIAYDSLSQVFDKLLATNKREALYLYISLLIKLDRHSELRQICRTLEKSITDQVAASYLQEIVNILDRKPITGTPQSEQLHRSQIGAEGEDGRSLRPITGTSQADQLYQKAAVENTAGNLRKAEQLFIQAIKKGGGPQVYAAYIKMLSKTRRSKPSQQQEKLIQEARDKFPQDISLQNMHGQMKRRNKDYMGAEKIFRQGLFHNPQQPQFRLGLAQVLVEIGTQKSLEEAGQIYDGLDKDRILHKDDGLYQQFAVFHRNLRSLKAYQFFDSAGMKMGIPAPSHQRTIPQNQKDLVVDLDFSDSFGLQGSFLIRCFENQPTYQHLTYFSQFLGEFGPHDVLNLQTRPVQLNPVLAFIAVPQVDTNLRNRLISRLTDTKERIAIIPLDDEFFQSSQEPQEAVHELLTQYLGHRDLYNSTSPVSGRHFFGREHLLGELNEEIRRGEFLGIYGLRKIGKTSLVDKLREEQLKGSSFAYVDLQSSLVADPKIGNCDPLYWELERDLYNRFAKDNQKIANVLRLGKEESFTDLSENILSVRLIFSEDIRAFLELLKTDKIPNIKRLVILLDELEQILPVGRQSGVDGYVEFFTLLRGLAQSYHGLLSNVIVAANAVLSEASYLGERENPVFAFYKSFFLPPLPKHECVEMIIDLGKGMCVYWDENATNAVFAETGGHPFITRQFCSYIQKEHAGRPLNVTEQMVQVLIDPFLRDESHLMKQIIDLLYRHFPEEETILRQIALEEAPTQIPDEALKHLQKSYHLIEQKDGGYRVTLNLLRRWLRRQKGIRE